MLLVSPVLREAKDRATFGNDSCHQAPRLVSGENWVFKVASEKLNGEMAVDRYLLPPATGGYISKIISSQKCLPHFNC